MKVKPGFSATCNLQENGFESNETKTGWKAQLHTTESDEFPKGYARLGCLRRTKRSLISIAVYGTSI